MATFKKMKLADQDWPTVCEAIRTALTAGESVEVVARVDQKAGKVITEVRVWLDIRKDKSNDEGASEAKDY